MPVDIAQTIEDIKKEALRRRDEPVHPDHKMLKSKTIRIRPQPVPFMVRLINLLKRERLSVFRRVYGLPLIGYGLKWLINIVRLPTRLQQLYDNQKIILQRLGQIEYQFAKSQDNHIGFAGAAHASENQLRDLLKGLGERMDNETNRFNTLNAVFDESLKSHSKVIFDTRDRLQSLHENLGKAQGDPKNVADVLKEDDSHALDRFYYEFEQRFRGSEEAIRSKQEYYLKFFKREEFDYTKEMILDVGCGRGEWLQVLTQNGYSAKGLDLNRIMVEECKAKGLQVAEQDVLSFLKDIPSGTLGALTGFHIVEHLPFRVLIRLIDETLRALKSGGMVIFETPNPENIVTGACNFYVDPTHLNPLPPPTLAFFLEQRGFIKLNVQRLSPVEKTLVSEDALTEDLARWLYREQDYGIIAYKP